MSLEIAHQENLDCRGMQCPAPILKTARAARSLGGLRGTLEILADDEAFPLDIESWCRSAGHTLVAVTREASWYRALVLVDGEQPAPPAAVAAPTSRPRPVLVAPADDRPRPRVSRPASAPSMRTLDCLGRQCPEPILEIARAVRALQPGQRIGILADDPAFPMDIESWCRTAGHDLVELDEGEGRFRAVVGVGAPRHAVPRPASNTVASARAERGAHALPSRNDAEREAGVSWLDLTGLDADACVARLDALVDEAPMSIQLRLSDQAAVAQVMSWCTAGGHHLVSLDTRATPIRAELEIIAPGRTTSPRTPRPLGLQGAERVPETRAEPAVPKCTLLVLHNDLEALLAALLVANGAAAQGMQTSIFFSFWGLNLLRGGHFEQELVAPAQRRPWWKRLLGLGKRDKVSSQTALARASSAPKVKPDITQKMFKAMMPAGPHAQGLGKLNFAGMGPMMMGQIMKRQNVMSLAEMMRSAIDQDVRFIACTMSMSVMGITDDDLMDLPNLVHGGVATFVGDASDSNLSLVF